MKKFLSKTAVALATLAPVAVFADDPATTVTIPDFGLSSALSGIVDALKSPMGVILGIFVAMAIIGIVVRKMSLAKRG